MENFPPRIGPSRCFLPHFSKFPLSSILRFDQVTMLLWAQFEKDFLPSMYLYLLSTPLRIRPRPRTGCPFVFQYPSRRGGNRGMKLKKAVYQLLDDTGRVDVGGFSCFALHRSRFRMLNRGEFVWRVDLCSNNWRRNKLEEDDEIIKIDNCSYQIYRHHSE